MIDFVSVIIPTFNRASLLRRAINSVLNQSYKNFELIIIDDGSTDQTEQLLNELAENSTIRCLKKDNAGVAHSRNCGAGLAKGKWYAFLDSDDEWHPRKLEEQMQFLKENSHLKIAYTDEIWIRNDKRVNQKKGHQKYGGNIFEQCLKQCFIAPSSVIIHRDLFLEMNGFDESFVVCEDYDLWLRISSLYEVGLLSLPLVIKYGGHSDQLSTQFFAMDKWRILSMKKILSEGKIPFHQVQLVKEVLQEKGAILMLGLQKHGHHDEAEALRELLDHYKIR